MVVPGNVLGKEFRQAIAAKVTSTFASLVLTNSLPFHEAASHSCFFALQSHKDPRSLRRRSKLPNALISVCRLGIEVPMNLGAAVLLGKAPSTPDKPLARGGEAVAGVHPVSTGNRQ
jgi:hypothetical protein